MNVAYHLSRMGLESHMISRVGADEAGRKILKVMDEWGIITTPCQIDPDHPTGEARPVVGDDQEVSYDLLFPAAWDYISWEAENDSLLSTTTAVVYGSLAARSETSYKTLLHILDQSRYNVLDVNLREPYYSADIVCTLLRKAQLLKVNQAELGLICSWIGKASGEEVQKVALLQDQFTLEEIIVTKGSHGASYYAKGKQMHVSAPKVNVIDTVGSGDAFLAGFLSEKLRSAEDIKSALTMGCALGALVAGKAGACPAYDPKELQILFDASALH
jgi:fructokinase